MQSPQGGQRGHGSVTRRSHVLFARSGSRVFTSRGAGNVGVAGRARFLGVGAAPGVTVVVSAVGPEVADFQDGRAERAEARRVDEVSVASPPDSNT